MDCPTCQHLGELVANTSRDWAFAEQLLEVSGTLPEFVGPLRLKAEAARKAYDLALRTLAEHKEQCPAINSANANGAAGVA
ncbi:MAG TPA: hypothetical protein VFU86_03365 [Terriglobales bacterium]|nr:hypothetical protein [Terriglobales bacterium]